MNLTGKAPRLNERWARLFWCGLLAGAACAAHAQAQTDTGLVVQFHQSRVSGFLDGNLLADGESVVAHPNADGLSYATMQLQTSFPFGLGPNWRLGAFVGAQAWIKTDAVRAAAFINNKEQADENAAYPLNISYQVASRRGLSLAKTTPLDLPQFASSLLVVRARVFVVDRFKAGQSDGTLIETASGQLGLQANVNQYQMGGTSPFINPAKTLGRGATFDLGLHLEDHDGNYGIVSIADVGPAVRLSSVLRTDRKANTNNVSYDANGYAQYAPLIKGQYSAASYRFRFTPTLLAEGGLKVSPNLHMIARLESTAPVHQIAVGGVLNVYQQRVETVAYLGPGIPASLGIDWRFKYGNIGWRGDRLSLSRARVWGITASLHF